MPNWNPSATITELDSPDVGWYRARTSYGTSCFGTRVKGTETKFRVGQIVGVVQIGTEFGFSENILSQLQIPGALIPQLKKDAPASVALNIIGNLANNKRSHYATGTIEAVISSNKVQVGGKIYQSEVSGFSPGDGCLIALHPGKPVKVLGWWQTAPDLNPRRVIRIRSKVETPTVFLTIEQLNADGSYTTLGSNFVRKWDIDPYLNAVNLTILRSSNDEDYIYVYAEMYLGWTLAKQHHYFKVNKETLEFEYLDEDWITARLIFQGLFADQPDYTTTADDKYWHHDNNPLDYDRIIYTSETPEGEKTPVFLTPPQESWFTPPRYGEEHYFPAKDFVYLPLEVSS